MRHPNDIQRLYPCFSLLHSLLIRRQALLFPPKHSSIVRRLDDEKVELVQGQNLIVGRIGIWLL
jgi:hypothetical protein